MFSDEDTLTLKNDVKAIIQQGSVLDLLQFPMSSLTNSLRSICLELENPLELVSILTRPSIDRDENSLPAILSLTLYEDIFDSLPIQKTQDAFVSFEVFIKSIYDQNSTTKSEILHFQRIANRLLSRLSASENAVLRGRLLTLMSYALALDERSGLNLKHLFNSNKEMKLSEQVPDDAYKVFYSDFWKLQGYLSNPVSLKDSKELVIFCTCLDTVMSCFESFVDLNEEFHSVDMIYFPRYMTNAELTRLQSNAASFRTQVLIQCLFIFDFCISGCAKISLGLSTLHIERIEGFKSRAEVLLTKMYKGTEFIDILQSHLNQERLWSSWKDDRCPSFVVKDRFVFQDILNCNDMVFTLNKGDSGVPEVLSSGAYDGFMGRESLFKLWEMAESNLQLLSSDGRNFLPDVNKLIQKGIEDDENDDDFGDDDLKLRNDPSYNWKLLRLLQIDNLSAFKLGEGGVGNVLDSRKSKKRKRSQ